MNRQIIIDRAEKKIRQLPESNLKEINDFIDFLLSKMDDKLILENLQKLSSESKSFDFLKDEEELYNVNDLKVTQNWADGLNDFDISSLELQKKALEWRGI